MAKKNPAPRETQPSQPNLWNAPLPSDGGPSDGRPSDGRPSDGGPSDGGPSRRDAPPPDSRPESLDGGRGQADETAGGCDAATSAGGSEPSTVSFEQAMAELEEVVRRLESGELELSESLAAYERGVARLRLCHQLLGQAEAQIALLTRVDAEGHWQGEPFRTSSDRRSASPNSSSGNRSSGEPVPRPDALPGALPQDDVDEDRIPF